MSNSVLTSFKNYRLKVSETHIVLAEVYWSWKSYFCNRRCNFGILGWHVAIDLPKINFTYWWSLMMVKFWLYKYSWKRFYSRKHIESLFFILGISFLLIHVNSLTNILLLDFCWKFYNKAWFCSRSAPNPSELASVFNLVGKFGLKFFRMRADVIKTFNFPIASN